VKYINSVYMNRYWPLIWILSAVVSQNLALTEGEQLALISLTAHIPILTSTTPPWSTNAANAFKACDKPHWYGLSCSSGPDPHVIELYVLLLPFCLHLPILAQNNMNFLLPRVFNRLIVSKSLTCWFHAGNDVFFKLIRAFVDVPLNGPMPIEITQLPFLQRLYVTSLPHFWTCFNTFVCLGTLVSDPCVR
jgi:hypothetical protein